MHIAGFQGAEYDGCLVPYLLVLHVQSMIFIDCLPSSNWKYLVNILILDSRIWSSGDDDKEIGTHSKWSGQ